MPAGNCGGGPIGPFSTRPQHIHDARTGTTAGFTHCAPAVASQHRFGACENFLKRTFLGSLLVCLPPLPSTASSKLHLTSQMVAALLFLLPTQCPTALRAGACSGLARSLPPV
eukprot:UN1049